MTIELFREIIFLNANFSVNIGKKIIQDFRDLINTLDTARHKPLRPNQERVHETVSGKNGNIAHKFHRSRLTIFSHIYTIFCINIQKAKSTFRDFISYVGENYGKGQSYFGLFWRT